MNVTPEFLDDFRREFDEAVETLCEKYGISMKLGRITYEHERFSATPKTGNIVLYRFLTC